MRRRRAVGSSSFGTLRTSRRDIASKSNALRCEPPSEARRLSGRCPACEWMNAARRMSESRTASRSTSARKAFALRACAACHACVTNAAGIAASQSTTRPSSAIFSPMPVSTSRTEGSFGDATRAAAAAHNSDSVPRSPPATSARISRSRRSAALRRRSPSMPRGATSPSISSTIDDSERIDPACRPLVDQHEREVVAQLGEVAVAREERGPQLRALDRLHAGAVALAGREEQPLFVKGGDVVHGPSWW